MSSNHFASVPEYVPTDPSVHFFPLHFFPLKVTLLSLALLLVGSLLAVPAVQSQSVVPPAVERVDVRIERGQDIVQIPALWYQKGDAPPDSLGELRVPRFPEDPSAIAFTDLKRGFPAHFQMATFHRDGQVAELQVSRDVLNGEVDGRIIIRPPEEDHFDIAEPIGVTPIRQEPGRETIVDIASWYEESLRNSQTGGLAPNNQFHAARELRGYLRSTAEGGEVVPFYIVASPELHQEIQPVAVLPPRIEGPFITPTVRETEFIIQERQSRARVEWISRTGFVSGLNRANLPERQAERFEAFRFRSDVTTSLRWHPRNDRWFEATLFAKSQPTFSDDGNHHSVPYGMQLAARLGDRTAFVARTEAAFEDAPFQQQSLLAGDERIRMLFGIDSRSTYSRYHIMAGPTYFRDRPSIFEDRPDGRQVGLSAFSEIERVFTISGASFVVHPSSRIDRTWGFIMDSGFTNTQYEGRLGLRYRFAFEQASLEIGPVVVGQYRNSSFPTTRGITDWSILPGLEIKTRIPLFGDL